MAREDLSNIHTGAYHAKNRLLDPWCEFGLEKSPFSSAIDFTSGVKLSHFQDVIDSLNYFASSSETFSIVSGYKGVGKTTVIDAFIADSDKITYKIKASSSLTKEELVEDLVYGFRLDIPEYGISNGAKLALFLDEVWGRAENSLLIIDDAHLLNLTCINMIFELISKQKDTGYLKVILTGRESLFERIVNNYTQYMAHVRPLHFIISAVPEHQIKSYLHSCLVRANWPDILPEISTGCLKQIYELSGGIPCRINMAADKILCNYIRASRYPEENNSIKHNSQNRFDSHNAFVNVFIYISYIVMLFGCYGWYASVLFQQQIFAESTERDHIKSALSSVVKKNTDAKIERDHIKSTVASVVKKNTDTKTAVRHGFKDREIIAIKYADNRLLLKQSVSDINSMGNTEFLNYLAQSENNGITAGNVFSHKPQVGSNLKVKVDTGLISAARKTFAYDGGKINSLNGYTIQIMGSHDINAINKFKNSTRLASQMYVYKTMLGNKDWNILIYNSFKSYPEAKREQAKLRSSYHLQNVWVKSLDVVHKEINKT